MPVESVGARPVLVFKIGGQDIGDKILSFEWKSFVNGGYTIIAKFDDSYYTQLNDLMAASILPKARNSPVEVKFRLEHSSSARTEERTAYVTDTMAFGHLSQGRTVIMATDPPSWLLNAGSADGRVYKGRISDVLKKVVNDFAPGVEVEITQTRDSNTNMWWMMRMDPKTFIASLLGWSPSLTDQRTDWLVASVDHKLIIKQQHEMVNNGIDLGEYRMCTPSGPTDVIDVELLSDTFVSVLQSKLVTAGISSVTGEYIDQVVNRKSSVIEDSNTENKINTKLSPNLAYAKPTNDWATFVKAIPEFNGGELGIRYSEYIDGNARNTFMKMLPLVMRIRATVLGDFRLHDSSKLGVSKALLSMYDIDGKPYFLHGPWLVYGFCHRLTQKRGWYTDLYMYRGDHNNASRKV